MRQALVRPLNERTWLKNKPRARARGDNSRAVYPNSGHCTGFCYCLLLKRCTENNWAAELPG
jgi:hypothetical protein